jgi:hypothetical protein
MTARDTIAGALAHRLSTDGYDEWTDEAARLADAVIAAVRAMPVEDQAELIGGRVTRDVHLRSNPTRRRVQAHVIGPMVDEGPAEERSR